MTAQSTGPPARPAASGLGSVVVTGGSRGIGAATCVGAARAGWDVAIVYGSRHESADRVAEAVRAQGRRAIVIGADVCDEAAARSVFERAAVELGPVRGLVNNAGVVAMRSRLVDMDVARWRRVFEVNVIGTLLYSREAVRAMSTRTGGPGGSIVNLSSAAARLGGPAVYVDYAASKGALDTLTVGLARELGPDGIRVNALRPGIIDTGIHADAGDPDRAATAGPSIPLGRVGRPDEVAEAAVWLLSEAASYTTGALLDVGGGR